MQQRQDWKYKVLEIKPKFLASGREKHIEDELNKLGSKGWELVSVQQHTVGSQTVAFFRKRL